MSSLALLEQLTLARRIAVHADYLGVTQSPPTPRTTFDHLGAVLADTILQAGVNYRTVVRLRVERIQLQFPEAATLTGLVPLLERVGASEFLLWNHPTKLMRFVLLTQFLARRDIDTTSELRRWLCRDDARENLLSLHGIGPKTYDYMCCLVGIDRIAVDRHIRTFANEAGVYISDYEVLRCVFSCAADLLGMSRRDFDAWIWQTVSARQAANQRPLID